jgi:hypothetical protein
MFLKTSVSSATPRKHCCFPVNKIIRIKQQGIRLLMLIDENFRCKTRNKFTAIKIFAVISEFF